MAKSVVHFKCRQQGKYGDEKPISELFFVNHTQFLTYSGGNETRLGENLP